MNNKWLAVLILACVSAGAQVPVNASSVAIDGNVVLPNNLTGSHGNATKVQLSDGTGSVNSIAVFDAYGNLTNGGLLPGISQNNVTGSRAFGPTYQNTDTTARWIAVTGYKTGSYSQGFGISCYSGPTSTGLVFNTTSSVHNDQGQTTVECFILAGYYYAVKQDNDYVSNPQTPSLLSWFEYGGFGATPTSAPPSMVYPGAGIAVSSGTAWLSSLAPPAGQLVGTTDTQSLTNKTVDGVTPTTMGYLDATSSIQTQLNNALPVGSVTTINGTACFVNGSCTISGGGGGSGTVTGFSAPSVSWPSWLAPTVTNPSTTPSLAVVASTVPVSSGGTGSTTFASGQALIGAGASAVTTKALAGSGAGITTGPTTSTTGDCVQFTGTAGQIADAGSSCGSGGSTSFSSITAGSNTNALTIGSGGSLTPTGTGTVTANGLTNNTLIGSMTANFISADDSLGLQLYGGFDTLIANQQKIPTGSRNVNAIGSASLADLFYCPTTNGCTAGSSYPYQIGSFPLTWPLGITNNTLFVTDMIQNDISNMGDNPTQADLDYFFHAYLAWIIMGDIPDAQKVFANNTTYCTVSGTSVAAGSPYPTGFLNLSTGASLTCTGLNATDAGMIGMKIGSSTSTFTVSVTTNGTTYNAQDSFNGNSLTANQTAPYVSAWGGDRDMYAFGVPGLPGGLTSITYTCTSADVTGCIVAGPYWLSSTMSPQYAPRFLVMKGIYYCGNASCSTIDTGHVDSVVNTVRTQQVAAVTEAKSNGLNVGIFDAAAPLNGYNTNQIFQTSKLLQIVVSSGGSGYTSGVMNFSGCDIAPTMTIPVSGGVLTPGTYTYTTIIAGYSFTNAGACVTVPTVTGTGGSGASITASLISDGTHPNARGAANIAAVAGQALNSAVSVQDRGSSSIQSSTVNASGPFVGSTVTYGTDYATNNMVFFQTTTSNDVFAVTCQAMNTSNTADGKASSVTFTASGYVGGGVAFPQIIASSHVEAGAGSGTTNSFGTPFFQLSGTVLQMVIPMTGKVGDKLYGSCVGEGSNTYLIWPGTTPSGTIVSGTTVSWNPGGPISGSTSIATGNLVLFQGIRGSGNQNEFAVSCQIQTPGWFAGGNTASVTFVASGYIGGVAGTAAPKIVAFTHGEGGANGQIAFGTPYLTFDGSQTFQMIVPTTNTNSTPYYGSCTTDGANSYSVLGGQTPSGTTISGTIVSWNLSTALVGTSLTVNGPSTFANGGSTVSMTVGSGSVIALGSDAYIPVSSVAGKSAGIYVSRGDNTAYASFDLVTGNNPSTGWSQQVQPGNSDWRLYDRANSVNAIDCQAGVGNPCTFGKPLVATSITTTGPSSIAGYQPSLTLTTTGTSGSATLSGSTLNVPNYSSGCSCSLGGTLSSSNISISGWGTGATATVVGLDGTHQVSVASGTGTTSNSPTVTVTFTASRGHVSFCSITPSSTAVINSLNQYMSANSATAYTFAASAGGDNVPNSTTFVWNITCP